MRRSLRRLVLTAHVIVSVGWLGLTLGVLTLGIEGLAAHDRSAYTAMRVIADVLLIPVSITALATGVVLGLGTRWGLFRHWWVLVKLGLTLVTTGATIFALRPTTHQAVTNGGAGMTGVNLVVAPSVGLVVYGTATVLSIYKPWGRRGVPKLEA